MAFVLFAVIGFGLTFLSIFMRGLGLMDGKHRAHGDSYYVKRSFIISGAVMMLAGLFFAGLPGMVGAAVGAGVTYLVLGRNL